MAFSSVAFVIAFLPVVFLLHCLIPGQRGKNAVLIAASLLFYAAGSLRHLPLLLAVALVNFLCGLAFRKRAVHKKAILIAALVLNLGALAVFKYLDFAVGTVNGLFSAALPLPGVALPIGISFFTFQGLSYTIDVYRDPDAGTQSFWELLLYLSFFPQLVAGPIVQYHDVSAQIRERRPTLEDMARGCRRFIVGLSKKLLLADLLAHTVDLIYANSGVADVRLSFAAAVCYMLQIYFDFSGYSDMAIGMGRMFGFRFLENFNYPYAASSIRDFWRRWHISLSSWFRDYLYIPLGGNRRGLARTCLNTMIVFLLTGLWHGASWTFVLWGIWHGVFSVLERTTPLGKLSGKPLGRVYTLVVVMLGFVLFRADTIPQAWELLRGFGCLNAGAVPLLRQAINAKVIVAAVIGAVLSTGVTTRAGAYLDGEPAGRVLCYGGAVVLYALCFLRLASASFNPFIYFRF